MASNSTMLMGKNPTILEYISDYNSEDIVSSIYFLKQVFTTSVNKKLLVNFQNLVIKYMPELKAIKTTVTMTNEEYAKYKYNPKLLSYDIYGTTELWFLILEANELHASIQFDLKTIQLFNTSVVDKMVRILNLEREFIDYNEEEISAALLQ